VPNPKYPNKHAEKYESLIKQYLSQKIKAQKIEITRVKDIIENAAQKTKTIQSEDDIDKALQELDKQFDELEELTNDFHLKNLNDKRKRLEFLITEMAGNLILEDIDKAQEVLAFADNTNATIDDFYSKFPMYHEWGEELLSKLEEEIRKKQEKFVG